MSEDLKVAYAVTTYNGSKLVQTIHSIPVNSRLLVIDQSQRDQPLSAAWNYAYDRLIEYEKFDYVVVMNDDVIIREETGQLLANALYKGQYEGGRPFPDQLILLVSAYNIRDVDPKTFGGVEVDWCPRPYKDQYGPDDLSGFKPRWGEGPDFSCFCFGKPLFQQMGRFDEKIPLYFEDNDAHYRIRGSGYEALSYAPYWHYGSTTTNSNPEIQERVANKYRQSEAYYIAKWGGSPGYEIFKTPFGR
jgi:hypothetical protein